MSDEEEEPDASSFILGTEANVVMYRRKTGVLSVHVFDLRKSSTGEEQRSARLALPPGTEAACANTKSALMCLDADRNTLYHTALPIPEPG